MNKSIFTTETQRTQSQEGSEFGLFSESLPSCAAYEL